MKFVTLTTPGLNEIYLFPTEGIIIQADPDDDKQTLIAVAGTQRRVIGDPEDIAHQIERMFVPEAEDPKA